MTQKHLPYSNDRWSPIHAIAMLKGKMGAPHWMKTPSQPLRTVALLRTRLLTYSPSLSHSTKKRNAPALGTQGWIPMTTLK